MSKKNAKVIEIKARAASGNDRTIYSVAYLGAKPADLLAINKIPLLSVISIKETAPMTEKEAVRYAFTKQAELMFNPNTRVVKCNITQYVD